MGRTCFSSWKSHSQPPNPAGAPRLADVHLHICPSPARSSLTTEVTQAACNAPGAAGAVPASLVAGRKLHVACVTGAAVAAGFTFSSLLCALSSSPTCGRRFAAAAATKPAPAKSGLDRRARRVYNYSIGRIPRDQPSRRGCRR